MTCQAYTSKKRATARGGERSLPCTREATHDVVMPVYRGLRSGMVDTTVHLCQWHKAEHTRYGHVQLDERGWR